MAQTKTRSPDLSLKTPLVARKPSASYLYQLELEASHKPRCAERPSTDRRLVWVLTHHMCSSTPQSGRLTHQYAWIETPSASHGSHCLPLMLVRLFFFSIRDI